MTSPAPLNRDEFAAAVEWWRMAGIDLDFSDDVTDWLEKPADGESATAEPTSSDSTPTAQMRSDPAQLELQKNDPPQVDLLGNDPPSDLTGLSEWWMTAPGLDPIGPRGRVPPRGSAGAKVMLLVVHPEEGDGDALLSGPQGRLLAKMLSAMGLDEGDLYVASALTRYTPMADTVALSRAGMRDVLAHHIALAEPESIVAFGANILPLLGHEMAQDLLSLREINQNKRSIPLLVSEGLDSLMASPRLKARFWRRWIEWSANR